MGIQNSPLLGPGSRLSYRLMLTGDAETLQQVQQQWTLEVGQSFETLQQGNQRMAESLDRAQRYLAMGSLLAVVLASIAVAISAQRYASRHFDISALMRTFGLHRDDVLRLYLWQLVALGILAAMAGGLLALGLQQAMLWMLADILPNALPSAPISAWVLGLSSGLITLLGFGVPQLLPLANVAPLRVLRRDMEPVPLAGWALTGLSLASLALMLWIMAGGSTLVLILLGLLQLAIRALRQRLTQVDLPLSWRFAWQHLSRDSRKTAGQILAFSLTLQVMVVIAMLRNDLLADWQASLPENAPNVFALNIQSYERDAFMQSLQQQGFRRSTLFPMVPGRLLTINDQTIQELGLAHIGSIDRDLALTGDAQLPDSNRVVAGDWTAVQSSTGQVSIEEGLAERLGVGLGDQLGFRAAGVDFSATISSIRQVDWGSLSPNFFMMFSNDIMEQLPASYITSFHVPVDQQARLTQLIRDYPAVNILDMQALLGQLQTLLQQLTLAVELILVIVLVAAVLVMVSALIASLSERLREGALLRTLGASSAMIRRAQLTEFALLGGIASVLALIASEALIYGLYTAVLNIPWQTLGWIWFWLPLLAGGALAILGNTLLRKTVTVAPQQVLRDLG